MNKLKFYLDRQGLKVKLAALFSVITIVSVAFLVVLLNLVVRAYFRASLRDRLRDAVSLVAIQVDADQHAELVDGIAQEAEVYAQLRRSLLRARQSVTGIDSFYTMRQRADGRIVFVVDGSDDPMPVGEVYQSPSPLLAGRFASLNQALVEPDLYTDEWGTWLSGYAPLYRTDGQREAVLGADISADELLAQERQILVGSLAVFAACLPVAIVLGLFFASLIARPVIALTQPVRQLAEVDAPALTAAALAVAQGDLRQIVRVAPGTVVNTSQDEIGHLAQAFNRMAQGCVDIGSAFNRMIAGLNATVVRVAEGAAGVGSASVQLADTATQTGRAASQIAATMQQVALGTQEQSHAATLAAASMEQIKQVIDGVAQGTQEQAQAVAATTAAMSQLAEAVAGLRRGAQAQIAGMERAANAQASLQTSLEAVGAATQSADDATVQSAQSAGDGTRLAGESIAGMRLVQATTEELAGRVRDLGERTGQIGAIIETIGDIASQTNLLALNAAIEAARVDAQSGRQLEESLNASLSARARLVAHALTLRPPAEQPAGYWAEIALYAGVEAIYVTDKDGVVEFTNETQYIGWRFSDDPKAQSFEFRQLLGRTDGVVCQPIMNRNVDNQPYKFVGVARQDQPGIVQVGLCAASLLRHRLNAAGFAVVADEVRKLAERSTAAAKEIAVVVRLVQTGAGEVVEAMRRAGADVDAAARATEQAGAAFRMIAEGTQALQRQVRAIGRAVQAMLLSSQLLDASVSAARALAVENDRAADEMSALNERVVSSLDHVSAVVDDLRRGGEKMRVEAGAVMQAVENIASVSEENGAAVEEVSASAEEMSAQVEEVSASAQALAVLAQALQAVVGQFTLMGTGKLGSEEHALAAKPMVTPAKARLSIAPVGNGHRLN